MGCTSCGVDRTPNPRRRKAGKPIESNQADDFEVFGDEIRQELDPTGSIERLLAECVIRAAWRLKTAIERTASRSVESRGELETVPGSTRPNTVERAARSVREAFEAFDACRSIHGRRTTSAFLFQVRDEPIVEPNEWPIVPEPTEPIVDDDEIPQGRDRLTFDFEVSDVSPVVKGTWVTVGHIVSLIVDGWTWADILRSHPELTEDDIRACVSYAMEEENSAR